MDFTRIGPWEFAGLIFAIATLVLQIFPVTTQKEQSNDEGFTCT
jgi:hypothetical protein